MKISKETLAILSSFKAINLSLKVTEGSEVKTIHSAGVIAAVANIQETLPKFNILELNKFLDIIKMYNEPEIEFKDNSIVVQENNIAATIKTASDSAINRNFDALDSYIQKFNAINNYEVEFKLPQHDYQNLLKSASILKVDRLIIDNTDGEMSIKVSSYDDRGNLGDNYQIAVNDAKTESVDRNFRIIIPLENLLIISGDYIVKVSLSKKLVKLEHQSIDMCYYVAIHQDSIV